MEKGTKNFKNFIGIDISKKTLDYCILDLESKVIKQDKMDNASPAINTFIKYIQKADSSDKCNFLLCHS